MVHGLTTDEAVRRAVSSLKDVGIADGPRRLEQYPHELSGGLLQRVMICAALLSGSRLIVADEPTTALDVSVQAQILNLLVEIRRARGLSYVFVSHDLAVVRQISEHVIVMRKGTVVEAGLTADVLAHPEAPYTRLLRESVPRRGWRPSRSLKFPEPSAE